MATLVLTVIGDDRAGLVDALAAAVAARGGNWERSQMAELAGKFAGIVMVTVPDHAVEQLTADLDAIEHSGLLDITVERAASVGESGQRSRWTIDLLGADRPGIVREISAVLAAHEVNIDELRTSTSEAPMSGGVLFHAWAQVSIPEGLDLGALRRSLEALAGELMVELDVGEA
jgi:glycine cleavage system regulatory protein